MALERIRGLRCGNIGKIIVDGQAAGFLDPIFSSGVHLAITSAARAAEGVDALLRRGEKLALQQYQADMAAGLRVFQAFVERFYQRDLVRNLFFSADKNPRMRAAIINILAGHVWDLSNPLIAMLQANKPANASRADFAGSTSLEELQVASPAPRMATLDTGL